MVSKQLTPNIMAMVQPKAKRKYKTKKEKEKKTIFTTIGKDMEDGDLSKGKEQSIRDLVEEEVEMIPHKTKKKKGKDVVASNKVPTYEKMPSPMSKSRGRTEASMSLLIKMPPMAPKKSKGREKISNPSDPWLLKRVKETKKFHPSEEPLIHVNNLHS
jgi:hypothetical protein